MCLVRFDISTPQFYKKKIYFELKNDKTYQQL